MATTKTTRRKVLWTAAKVVFVAAALFFVGKIFADNWSEFRTGWRPPQIGFLSAAGGALVLSYFYLFAISLAVLRRVGSRLGFRAGLRPFFYSLLGRYIPGRFAVIVGKIYLYERRGVPRLTAALALAYENVFAAIGGLAVATVAAATVLSGLFSWRTLVPAAVGPAAAVALIQPGILRRLLGWALRRFGRREFDADMVMGRGAAASFALAYASYCLISGVFFAFFAAAFVPLDAALAVRVGAAYVAASVLGYAAVFTPSGLGVREGLVVLFLHQYLAPGEAAFLAVASRLATVIVELILAGFAAAVGTREEAANRGGKS
jgi:uncharacterized membrane protein YbhN (UPF0104 family)